jgi:UDP-N-acetyl-alpha-D-quinovosamine dehydrogenase
MRVLITGPSGFIGSALSAELTSLGHEVIPAVRRASGLRSEVLVGDIGPNTDWTGALERVDAVVHLAARVHIMHDTATDPLQAFRDVNTVGTLSLAVQAAGANVKRLIYLSTIKVNGEGSFSPYRETDVPSPRDPYAISKYEAEQGLLELAAKGGLEVVILRPPLVYGPGVGGNFRALMNAVRDGIPLPFGGVHNQRSLLFLGSLVDAIRVCLDHPAAANKTYVISDGEDISTPDLIRRLARAMNRPARLLPVPRVLLAMTGRLFGKHQAMTKLLGSLTVDNSAIARDLGWNPPYNLDDGLRITVSRPN